MNKPLCDSSISVCPRTFDYLIEQDIQAQKYSSANEVLEQANDNLLKTIIHKDKNIEDYKTIIASDSTIISVDSLTIVLTKKELLRANRTIARQKLWMVIEGGVGIACIVLIARKK